MTVAAHNLNSKGFPIEDIEDIFNLQIVEESLEEEEVPEENLDPVPVPVPSFQIPETLVEILPSPLLRAFLAQPFMVATSILLLGTSPQML